MKVSIVLGQFPISFDIEQNLNYINHILDKSGKDDLIILPEGALSGYGDDVSFLKNIDLKKLSSAMGVIKKAVIDKEVHIIFGSCIYQDLNWFNAAIIHIQTMILCIQKSIWQLMKEEHSRQVMSCRFLK